MAYSLCHRFVDGVTNLIGDCRNSSFLIFLETKTMIGVGDFAQRDSSKLMVEIARCLTAYLITAA